MNSINVTIQRMKADAGVVAILLAGLALYAFGEERLLALFEMLGGSTDFLSRSWLPEMSGPAGHWAIWLTIGSMLSVLAWVTGIARRLDPAGPALMAATLGFGPLLVASTIWISIRILSLPGHILQHVGVLDSSRIPEPIIFVISAILCVLAMMSVDREHATYRGISWGIWLWFGFSALLYWMWWVRLPVAWASAPHDLLNENRWFLASAMFAAGVLSWKLPDVRRITRSVELFTIVLGGALFVSMFLFSLWASNTIRYGLGSTAIVKGTWPYVILIGVGPFLVLSALNRWLGVETDRGALLVREPTQDGLPTLSWRQHVGTGETEADRHAAIAGRALICTMVVGGCIGWSVFGGQGAVVGALIGAWAGSHGMPGAARPDVHGNYSPHHESDAERRTKVTPKTRWEDCEAFIQEQRGEFYFCLARGDKSCGPLPIIEAVPWDSFQNFEEGTHRQWFRSRGRPNDMVDWGVIVAQSSEGRIVRVAESVDDQAWLTELLITLQELFIAPRAGIIRAYRESKIESPGQQQSVPVGHEAPVKPF